MYHCIVQTTKIFIDWVRLKKELFIFKLQNKIIYNVQCFAIKQSMKSKYTENLPVRKFSNTLGERLLYVQLVHAALRQDRTRCTYTSQETFQHNTHTS